MTSGSLVDLDAYRKQREAEGTWPPNELMVKEYWAGRRGMYDKKIIGTPKHEPLSELGRKWIEKIRGKKPNDRGPDDGPGAA